MAKRVGSPLGVALVAAVLAGLVTALVLSFVLQDDEPSDDATVITLDPDAPQPTLTAPPNTSVGRRAPDFEFETLDGDQVDFDDFRDGRPALINFFSRTCVPCVTEMPDLEAAHQEYGDDVAFLGLAWRDEPDQAQELVDETGVTYETGRDPAGDILTAYEGTALPVSVFVTADGTITDVYTRRVHPNELRQELEALVT
jgi:cytochrome c biogenesis protein CcmG/thiol:disulfide interchange protein DsbE